MTDNPHRKEHQAVANPKPSTGRYGTAQAKFIARIRKAIDDDPTFLQGIDWRRIPFSTSHLSLNSIKKISVDSFYVKDVAVWLPHVVIPHYIPTCYKCGLKSGVDVNRYEWVEFPKILYGMKSHRYLDSVYYSCLPCDCVFQALHEEVLELDAKELTGILNFRLSLGYAVDEELYSFIVAHATDTTALTHQRLKDIHADNWVNSAILYHRAILAKRIKPLVQKGPIDAVFQGCPETADQKRRKALRWEFTKMERQVVEVGGSFNADIRFDNIFRRKENRNSIGEIFPGIGKAKCQTLISNDIFTAKQLLAYEGDNPSIKWRWKDIVQNHYDNLESQLAYLTTKRDQALTELQLDESIYGDVNSAAVRRNENLTPSIDESDGEAEADSPPEFSSLTDWKGFNCRVVSRQAIDRINMTDFQRRKPLQEAKMRCIKAHIWKLDWHYKIASKIKVYTGKGKCFAPYKSALSVQQEDALTIFWKFYAGSESIETAAKDLRLLKKRNELLHSSDSEGDGSIDMCYVDNCCIVRPKLQAITGPGTLVKLDCFHWQYRWDDIMFDKKSEKTTIFRKLMRRALFCVEDSEYARAKAFLCNKYKQKKKPKIPEPYEIMKLAKATIPPAAELEKRVMAVLHALMEKDLEADMTRVTAASPHPGRFFKRGADTLNTIVNQLEHVKKGCLSDPPDTTIPLFRFNPRTGKTYTARSTGTNEVDNRYLNRLLDTPSVGLTRADRLIHNYYEKSNDRKLVNRLGHEPSETSRTEQMSLLHSVATECGFPNFPTAKPQYPNNIDDLDERIGFEYHLPGVFDKTTGEDEGTDSDEEEMVELLNDIHLSIENPEEEALLENDDNLEPIDIFATQSEIDVSIYVPTIVENERTYDTFVRKTQNTQWIPFAHPKDHLSFTALEKAEYRLFDELSPSYQRDCKRLDSAKGYKTFAKAWDLYVANLYRSAVDGGWGDGIQRINRKSYVQLQEHFDTLKRHKELIDLSSRHDPHLQRIERVFKRTRKDLPPHQSAASSLPDITYNSQLGRPQFGVPMTLNTQFAAAAFQYNNGAVGPAIVMRPAQLPTKVATRSSLGKLFKHNKYCWRCGFQKRLHVRSGTPFGDKCRGNCLYEQCSKCNQRVIDYHAKEFVGPHCPHPTAEATLNNVSDWYKEGPATGTM